MAKIDESRLQNNPFAEQLVIPVARKWIHAGKHIAQPGDLIKLPPVAFYERTQFAKVFYTEGVKKLIYTMPEQSIRLFLFIIYHLERGKDYIYLRPEAYLEAYKLRSKTSFKDAKAWLVDNGFIARSGVQSVYWINPRIFFCGDRIKKYPTAKTIISEL